MIAVRIARVLVAALLLSALCACSHGQHHEKTVPARLAAGAIGRVTFADPALGRDIEVIRAETRKSGDSLEATVELRSSAKKARDFEYLFRWHDGGNKEVRDAKARWMAAQVLGDDKILLEQKAPSPDCTDFSLSIRKK